jgi:hypothetical protein
LNNSRHIITIIIHDVLVIPDLSANLFSMVRFTMPRQSVLMEGPNVNLSQNGSVILTATIKGSLAYLDASTAFAVTEQQSFITADLQRWHNRLGHLNYRSLIQLSNSGAVEDLKVLNKDIPEVCIDCVQGKLSKAAHASSPERSRVPLDRIYSDVEGPFPIQGRQGQRYVVTFLDDHSRLGKCYNCADEGCRLPVIHCLLIMG